MKEKSVIGIIWTWNVKIRNGMKVFWFIIAGSFFPPCCWEGRSAQPGKFQHLHVKDILEKKAILACTVVEKKEVIEASETLICQIEVEEICKLLL